MLCQFRLAGSTATFQSQKSAVCILLLTLNSSGNDIKDATLFLIQWSSYDLVVPQDIEGENDLFQCCHLPGLAN